VTTHLHPVYLESCKATTGILTTNQAQVDCPECLSRMAKGIDLNCHPLADFFRAVAAEFKRGLDKYGEWSNLSHAEQLSAVKSECLEWEAASLKTSNDASERERQELTHLANCCGKRWKELTT
jgi:hypothetical protein